jgi:thiamine-phosphate pyrophosphorylase
MAPSTIKIFMISKLQFISQGTDAATHLRQVSEACDAGIRWVQLRMKDFPTGEILSTAHRAKEICDHFNARLIINDHPRIAVSVNACGVHLGKTDMPVAEARSITGAGMLIGATANTFADIVLHRHSGADYIGLGPLRFTGTKKNLGPLLGLEGYKRILRLFNAVDINIPVIAIGGIVPDDIPGLLQAGVRGVAVSGAIATSVDKKKVVQTMQEMFHLQILK